MATTFKLDKIDRKILEILQSNAKITNAQLSKDIGLSPAPTLERVKKLENQGIITSYHAKLDLGKIGLGVSTFVQVSLKGHKKATTDAFLKEIEKIDEVVECHHMTGTADFVLKIVAKDMESYQKLMLEKVSEIEVVNTLETNVILKTYKDSKVMPLPEQLEK